MPDNPLQNLARMVLSRLGLDSNPKPPKFNTSIDVKGIMPDYNDPYPPNMDEIILGSKTSRPTGSYIDNSHPTTEVSNRMITMDPMNRLIPKRLSPGKYDWIQEAYQKLLGE